MRIINLLFIGTLSVILSQPALATSPIRSWATDMYNQDSVKSFEQGGVVTFPEGSVTIDGQVIHSDGIKNDYATNLPWNDFTPNGFRYNPALTPANPVAKDARSYQNGKYVYMATCRACHGPTGLADSNLAKLRAVPAINTLVPKMSDGYIFMRVTYGGPNVLSMPAHGYILSEQERWDVVNYVKREFK